MAQEGGKRPREAAPSNNPTSRKDSREEIKEEPGVSETASSSVNPSMSVDDAQDLVDRASRLSKPGVEVIAPKVALETVERKKKKEKSSGST
eukprot:3441592-Karenia_brevis.AAC.1